MQIPDHQTPKVPIAANLQVYREAYSFFKPSATIIKYNKEASPLA